MGTWGGTGGVGTRRQIGGVAIIWGEMGSFGGLRGKIFGGSGDSFRGRIMRISRKYIKA